MPDLLWTRIQPLAQTDRAIDMAAMADLASTWRDSKARLESTSPANLDAFVRRLVRRLSVETGILERIYDLDRGTTEALVAHGFAEELVRRSSTDIEPSRLIDILRDQEAAIQLVMDCVAQNRPLTKGLIHELHAILVQHQDTTTAVDQFGMRVEIPLLKGRFKEHPNNPRRPDGSLHEYCPPIHVESEIEQLLAWLDSYSMDDPVLVATWFHHRFTQIHPYQDGNGRLVRALTNLILLRADLLPLVIDRDLRWDYIEALETADNGDLSQLAGIFSRLEKAAIVQALSIDADADIAHQRSLTGAVIESLRDKFERRRDEKRAELRRVDALATTLRAKTRKQLEDALNSVASAVSELGTPTISIADGGPDRNNAHWYKYEVVRSANAAGKFANFSEAHYFSKATIRFGAERLVFVTSFHHVGRELSGIMEATAFARIESFDEPDGNDVAGQDFFLCSLEPFAFAYKTRETEIADSFSKWLDAAIAVAIKEFADRI